MSTQPMNAAAANETRLLLARWAIRIVLILWAGFWTWFMVASGIGEGAAGRFHFLQAIFVVGPFVLVWFYPRLGGVLLVLVGAAAAAMFHHWFAQLALALPAVVCGLGLILTAVPRARPPEGA